MNAREIRQALQHDHDPKLVNCICAIAESLSAQQQEIQTLAEMLNQLSDILMQLGATTEAATNAVDEIRKQRQN